MENRSNSVKRDALRVIEDRLRELRNEHERLTKEMFDFVRKRDRVEREIEDCMAAARVFGGEEPAKRMDEAVSYALNNAVFRATRNALVHHVRPEWPRSRKVLFKDAALRVLRDVHPEGLKAAEVRERVSAQYGLDSHEKTAGMTLYRLKKEGLVRRDGFTWFFVPPSQREAQSAQEDPDDAASGSVFSEDVSTEGGDGDEMI